MFTENHAKRASERSERWNSELSERCVGIGFETPRKMDELLIRGSRAPCPGIAYRVGS